MARHKRRLLKHKNKNHKAYYNTFKTKKVKGVHRNKKWPYVRQIKSDFYMKGRVKYTRTVWQSSHYSRRKLREDSVDKELNYYTHDIEEETSDGDGGIIIKWKDSYVPDDDIIEQEENKSSDED